jgi:hypothetical protein
MSRKGLKSIYMKSKHILTALMLLGIFSVITPVKAQMKDMPTDHIMVMPGDIKWVDAPPSLPPGSKVAVIEGDPKVAGLFTMRLKIPANYAIMPHSHPADEHVTVLEGSCAMGMGEKFDEKETKAMPTSAFAVMKTGTNHFFYSKSGCTIQLHGMGPWGITYVNPADDPRNKK